MKTMMSCDDAFAALTAGPIELSGPNAQELMDHLESCGSCRQLADALRPATHLLHEVLPRQQREGLPLVLAEEDAAVARIMQQVERVSQPTVRSIPRSLTAAGFATAACALLVLLAPWWSARTVAPQDVRQQLSGFGLPPMCLQTATGQDPPQPLHRSECSQCHITVDPRARQRQCSLTLSCCTSCHAAQGSLPAAARPVDVTRLVAACGTCHTSAY